MNDLQLEKLQSELDKKKYLQSQTARQDLGGRMEYCKDCYFLKFDTEKKHLICNLDENSRVANQVCAKNYERGKCDERQVKPTSNRKRSNGKG